MEFPFEPASSTAGALPDGQGGLWDANTVAGETKFVQH